MLQAIRSIIERFARYKHARFVVPALSLVFLVVPGFAYAGFGDLVIDGITLTISWLVQDLYLPLMGSIMTLLMQLVTRIAMYNSFGTATAVTIGWVLMRDITNMILVVILLAMAFGTLLNQGGKLGDYKSLPKFAIVAIVINFSKMITLLMIDISQVVMLSFVAAFQNTAAGNFVKAFGIRDWFTLDNFGQSNSTGFILSVIIALALAAILVTVATVVLLVFVCYLIFRMVMLWILIIFSPLAFGLNLLPSRGKAYYDKWWEHLLSTLITGPLLAFFLWLTLIVAGVSNGAIGSEILADSTQLSAAHNAELGKVLGEIKSPKGSALTPDTIVTFLLTTLMLILGLKISIEMGGVVGQAASKYGLGIARRAMPQNLWRYGKVGARYGWKTGVGAASLVGRVRAPGGASLAEKAQIRAQQLKETKVARFFGADKDYTERKIKERKARYLRGIGKEADARQLEQQVISGERDKLKGLTQKQLVDQLKTSDKGSLEYQAVARELAKSGYFRSRLGDIDVVAGGNDDFKKDLLAEDTKLNYVDTAGKTAERAVVDKTASMTKGELNKFYASIDVDVQRSRSMSGEIVETADPVAGAKLSTLTSDTYRDLNAVTKKKVQKAMLTRMRNTTGADRQAMRVKFRELTGQNVMLNTDGSVLSAQDVATGAAVAPDRLEELTKLSQEGVDQQQQRLTTEAIKGARGERVEASSQDRVLLGARAAMSGGERRTLDTRLTEVQRDIQTLASAGSFDAGAIAAGSLRDSIRDMYEAQDRAGRETGITDASGRVLSHADAFDQSSIAQALAGMEQALQRRHQLEIGGGSAQDKAAADQIIRELQREIDAHSAWVRGDSPERVRRNRIVARKMLKEDMNALRGRMTSAKSAGSATDQQKAMKQVADMMDKVAKRLAQSNTAAGVRPDIDSLIGRIQTHIDGRAGKTNAQLMAELDALQRDINDLEQRVK